MLLFWVDKPRLKHFFICNDLDFNIFIMRIIIGFGEGTGRDLSVRVVCSYERPVRTGGMREIGIVKIVFHVD